MDSGAFNHLMPPSIIWWLIAGSVAAGCVLGWLVAKVIG